MEKDHFDIKAFNRGYLLAKHRPELVTKLISSLETDKSPKMNAMLKGIEKAHDEKSMPKNKNYVLPSLKKENKSIQKSKGQDLEK